MSDPSPIAGDFFSLLARNHAPSSRAGVSPDAPVQTQATTVFAFHFAEGVLMGGDRRATAGNVIVTDRVDKVIEQGNTMMRRDRMIAENAGAGDESSGPNGKIRGLVGHRM